jgi:hypothetical protein
MPRGGTAPAAELHPDDLAGRFGTIETDCELIADEEGRNARTGDAVLLAELEEPTARLRGGAVPSKKQKQHQASMVQRLLS